MARCVSCGEESTPGKRFCIRCGAPLGASCPSCGEAVEPEAIFCGECGASLSGALGPSVAAPSAPSPPSSLSERRVCSVLFADLVGFTTLSESRDPEDVRAVLSRYFEVARTVIARYGGVVEKFIGDAVMAVWGTPVANEGDTERAVRAALDLVSAVEVLGDEVGASGLSARAGVVTGEVAVSIGASGEGMVAGDAVNTASRVQAIARAGTVLVDEQTRRLSQSAIAFEDEGVHELKGKEAPERLHRAVRVLAGVGGTQRADGLEAPFTGREAEFRTLKELFHSSAERRSPRLVVISGPAGVGKSRLGFEFYKYIDGLAHTILWHRGRCLSYGEGVAFWALSEIVRQRFGIAEEDRPEVASQKLREGLVRFVQDESERDYVGVRLARLLGVEYTSESRGMLGKDDLFAGWRLFFERLAQVAPVVMLVEDAQHADPGLLEFFEHLIDWSRDLPIFVLLFARPGLDVIDSGYGVGRNRSTLSLDPLDTASMEALVDSLVPGMPAPSRSAITSHSQGIPLFAVETIRSLVDSGAVTGEGGAYHLIGDIGTLSVPDSLHALLAARLDALSPEVRALVADASVLGSTFAPDSLVAVSSQDEDQVRQGLAELVRRDVLEVSADPLSPQRGSYRFGQEMLRQVAYQTLSRRDRKVRHLAVAAHLRAVFANEGEEISDVIARHYLDARASGPEDEDVAELAAAAAGYLVRAAERAAGSGAPGRAATSYAEAAELVTDEHAAAELWEKAAGQSSYYGDYESALAQAKTSFRLYGATGDPRSAARARATGGLALADSGRNSEARQQLTEALAVLRSDPDKDTVHAMRGLAITEAFSGNTEEADRLSSEAISLGQVLDVDPDLLGDLLHMRGGVHYFGGRMLQAGMYFREEVRLAEQEGNPHKAASALSALSDVLAETDPLEAVQFATAAADYSRRGGRRAALANSIGNLVLALLELGEWEEAEAALNRAIENDGLDSRDVRQRAALVAGLRGDGEKVAVILRSLEDFRSSGNAQDQAGFALVDALSSDAVLNHAEALAHGQRAVGYAEAIGIRHESVRWAWPVAARAARSLGDTAALGDLAGVLDSHTAGRLPRVLRAERELLSASEAGKRREHSAAQLYSDAIAALREVGNPYELAHALVDHAAWLLDTGDGEEATLALDEARKIAAKLDCAPLLRRVEVLDTSRAEAR